MGIQNLMARQFSKVKDATSLRAISLVIVREACLRCCTMILMSQPSGMPHLQHQTLNCLKFVRIHEYRVKSLEAAACCLYRHPKLTYAVPATAVVGRGVGAIISYFGVMPSTS